MSFIKGTVMCTEDLKQPQYKLLKCLLVQGTKGWVHRGDITCEPSSENTDARMWNHCNVPYPGDMKKVGIHKSDLI